MADQAERVILEAEDNVTPIVSKANSALDGFDKKATAAGERQVRVNDQTRSSVQRLITSLEKQADVYGKTGVDKLIAQRDQLLQRYGKEPAAIDAITKSYQRMIEVQQRAATEEGKQFGVRQQSYQQMLLKAKEAAEAAKGGSSGGFSTRYAFLGAKDLLEGRSTNAIAEAANELTRLGGTALVIGGVAAAIVGVGVAGWESAKSLGAFATETNNISIRMGLATKEVEQFSFAAKVTGSDIGSLESTMRKLSQSLSDGGSEGKKGREALKDLGVEARNVDGTVKPMSSVFLQLSERLNGMKDTATRNAEAIRLFGRAGLEVLPTILALSENVQRARELGLGASEEEVKRWEKYHKTITEADAVWDKMVRKIKEPIAATVIIFYKWFKQGNGPGAPGIAESTVGGGPNDGMDEQDLPYFNDLRKNPRLYAPGFDPTRAGKLLTQTMTEVGGAKGLKSRMASGLEGAKSTLEDLKEAYDKAKNSAEALAANSQVLPAIADEAWQKLQKAEVSYKHQSDIVKELEKDESKRVSLLEKSRDLIREGETFYQVGRGPLAKLVTGEEMFKANPAPRGLPSLYRNGASPQVLAAAAEARFQDLKPGIDPFDGSFVVSTPDMEKANGGGNIAQLNARMVGQEDKRKKNEQVTLSAIAAEASYVEHIIQLRAGPGGEIQTAQKIAGIRQTALEMELQITGDVTRYREDSLKGELELRTKLAEIDEKRSKELEKTAGGLFHTLFTKPQDFGGQLGSTVHEAVLKPITEGLGKMSSRLLQPLIYGKDGTGGIAGLFGGGSKDPVRVSTDQNTAATVQNSAVMAGLTALLAAGMGVAAPHVSSGGGVASISMPSISMPSVSSLAGGFSPAAWGGASLPWGSGGGGVAASSASGGDFGGEYSPAAGTTGAMNPLQMLMGGGGGNPLQAIMRGGRSGVNSLLSGFKGFKWGGLTRSATGGDFGGEFGPADSVNGRGKITGVNGAAGAALGGGGMMLAQQGLLGSSRGTWGGVAEGTAGGAMIGFQQGGALGAAIGGGIGLAIGLGEKIAGVESAAREAQRLIQSIYGVNIPSNSGTIKQIVEMAKSQYGGSISVAVRSPSVRQLVMLYAEATGQRMPLSASTPYGGNLTEQGGGLYQQASYQDGRAHVYGSSLPTLGGLSASMYPTPGGGSTGGGGPTYVSLNIGGSDAAGFMTGQYVTPGFVTDQAMAAQDAGYGRTQQSANMNLPGLTVA